MKEGVKRLKEAAVLAAVLATIAFAPSPILYFIIRWHRWWFDGAR